MRDEKKNENRKWEIRFYKGGFSLFELNSVCADFNIWGENLEVIGNIYENKDLLK